MKGDFSRRTFDAKKHYTSLRMQQGRVQLDADWNEEADIVGHRVETEARDVIGPSGGPLHDAGFHLVTSATQLSPDDVAMAGNTPFPTPGAGDFAISAGRYYVDGILCENEAAVLFTAQPDLPATTAIGADGTYLAYLDVWQRHLTPLDDAAMRETALGGPDTATRVKTVWQVKVWPLAGPGPFTCIDALADLRSKQPARGSLTARETPAQTSTDPCLVPAGSGYKGLENQLYRIEIHAGGAASAMAAAAPPQITLGAASNLITLPSSTLPGFVAGAWVELFAAGTPAQRQVAQIVAASGAALTLNVAVQGFTTNATIHARVVATVYKWSRDNGCVVTAVEKIAAAGNDVTVSDLGRDDVLGFAVGQWVELFDDRAELLGAKTEIHQIVAVDRGERKLTLRTKPSALATTVSGVDAALHPKLRRWDGAGAVQHSATPADGWLDIESGIQIRFDDTSYVAHDYWLIPARVATADAQKGRIEWPTGESRRPVGIDHHLAALGLVTKAGATLTITDCRHLFPPLTELTSFFFLGGDGQEAKPDLTAPGTLVKLAHELRAGVANGQWPVVGAKVTFSPKTAGDKLSAGVGMTVTGPTTGTDITVLTDAKGVASVAWELLPSAGNWHLVEATLRSETGPAVHLPIEFGASLSIASEVAFDPKECVGLAGKKDVQAAIEGLAHAAVLRYAGGDGQEALPGHPLPFPLRVRVASTCGPVKNQAVQFSNTNGGQLGATMAGLSSVTSLTVLTGPDGYAECYWQLSTGAPPDAQEVVAEIAGAATDKVWFTARRSVASEVGYTPPADCETLKGLTTVQAAIDALCASGGACELVIRPEMSIEVIEQTLARAVEKGDVKVCFAPGTYRLVRCIRLVAEGVRTLVMTGAGDGTRFTWNKEVKQPDEAAFELVHFAQVVVRDLHVESVVAQTPDPGTSEKDDYEELGGALTFKSCGDVLIENVHVRCGAGVLRGAACITVRGAVRKKVTQATSVRIRGSRLWPGPGQIGALIVDTDRVVVEDNVVELARPAKEADYFDRLKSDPRFLSNVRRAMMFRMLVGKASSVPELDLADVRRRIAEISPDKKKRATLDQVIPVKVEIKRFSTLELTFQAPRGLAHSPPGSELPGFEQMVAEHQALLPGSPSLRQVRQFLGRAMEASILEHSRGTSEKWPALREWLGRARDEYRPAASQGIVVGGETAVEARIANNTIRGALQGIHVGLSGRNGRTRRARRVTISGNTVTVPLGIEGKRERHGVFVGNAENVTIEQNVIRIARTTLAVVLPIEGIRVYGWLGPLLMVRQNHVDDATIGIRVHALNAVQNDVPPGSLWRVLDNVAPRAYQALVAWPGSGMTLPDHPNL